MKQAPRWLLVAGLVLGGCSPGADSSGDSGSTSSEATSTTATTDEPSSNSQHLAAAWSAPTLADPLTVSMRVLAPNEAANPVEAGQRFVVLGTNAVGGYDVATGEALWETELPAGVCAGSRTVNDAGVMAVLLGADGECVEAAALDTSDGRILWKVPIPRAGRAFGNEVSVGSDMVVVTGECAGFSRLRLADGSVAGGVEGATVKGRCASATSDGSRIVLSSRGRLSVFDASSGRSQGDWAAEGLGRVGDILTTDPLVVTARYASGAKLVDLSGSRPMTFGRDRGWFGGEVPASYRLADTLWVQYDKLDRLVGYDLTTDREAGTVQVGYDAALVGTHDDQLVVAA
jgi:putative pyrroloquinoline-quinone binding quinoprotein